MYRRSTGQWFVRNQFAVQFGDAGDIPVPRDYNGDHSADVAVYRPSTGQWFVRNILAAQFGQPGDVPVPRLAALLPATPGDYDGDGTTDIAVYRPSTSFWFVRGQFAVRHAPLGNDAIPVPADYDNDGAMNVAIVVRRAVDGVPERSGARVAGAEPAIEVLRQQSRCSRAGRLQRRRRGGFCRV